MRLRVRQRADTLAPAARALGGTGCLSRLNAAHPLPSLPYTRCARCSVASLLAARRASAAALLCRSLRARFAPSLRYGVKARQPRFAWRAGLRPPLTARPRRAPTGLARRSLRLKCSASARPYGACSALRFQVAQWLPPALALGARGGCGWTPCPAFGGPPIRLTAHKRRARSAQ